MGRRSIGVLGCGLLAAALVAGPAVAQAPGAHLGRGGTRAVASQGGPAVGARQRARQGGFRGAGFGVHGAAPYGGLYAGAAGYAGSGRSAIDASVRTYPSPEELVPPAWSYGTYGIPTVPGITHPPSAAPVVYVIDGGRRPPNARVLSRGASDEWATVDPRPTAGGAKVVTVRVPAR